METLFELIDAYVAARAVSASAAESFGQWCVYRLIVYDVYRAASSPVAVARRKTRQSTAVLVHTHTQSASFTSRPRPGPIRTDELRAPVLFTFHTPFSIFLPRDAMRKDGTCCRSVSVLLTHSRIVSKRLRISSNFFLIQVATSF